VADTANNAIEINRKGEACFQDGDIDQAITCFEEAISSDPDYAEAYNNIACVYMQRNDYPTALEFITKAYGLEQNDQAIVLNIGSILAQLDAVDDAILVFRSYLGNNPDDTVVIGKLNELEKGHTQSASDEE